MHSPKVIPVEDASRVAEVRRNALAIATAEGMDESVASDCAIVATELATNLLKHAQRGEVHFLPLSGRGGSGLEILSIDHGPGMDTQKCLLDGYSTAGTPGSGLGAIQRLSSQLEVYSLPGQGTILAVQVKSKVESQKDPSEFVLGVAAKPIRGETVSGDAWAIRQHNGFYLMAVADGLGHGAQAAEASGEAIRIFLRSSADAPSELVQQIHNALRGSRGAAVSVARIEPPQNQVRFAGLGNVAGLIVNASSPGTAKSMISQNGTAGHEARQFKEFLYPITAGDLVIMHSDGLASHWNLQSSPGLLRKHPSIVAAALDRDYTRDRDDVCVIVGAKR